MRNKIMQYAPFFIIYVVIVFFIGYLSFYYGKMMFVCSNEIHPYNVVNYKLEREKKFQKALKDALQWYKENDSALWHSAFGNTNEYQRIILVDDESNILDEVK